MTTSTLQQTADQQHDLDWSDRLQDWLDGDLDGAARAELESHLVDCKVCQARIEELTRLDQALQAAAPAIALDASFDRRIFAQIDLVDESKRLEARRRIEQELQQNLRALSRDWRRALAFMVPGVIGGIALAFALVAWMDHSGLTRILIVESAGELGRDTSQLVRLALTPLLGTGLGLIVARWLASVVE